MEKQVLVDYSPFQVTPQQINESISNNDGRVIVEGVLQRSGAKNQNGRIYPKEILAREVAQYKKIQIAEKRALGELDHPESSVVNLNNVSHNILDCWWNGDDVVGKVEILSTPSGNILKELLKAGILLGISSRGLGSVKELGEGTVAVEDDFELICWDFVSNPSTHGAFMKPIGVNEGVIAEGVIQNQSYDKVNTIIRDILCEMKGCCPVDQGITMIKMSKIVLESKQEENYRKLDKKSKQLIIDAVNKFNKFEQHIYRQKDVREVVEAIKTISEYAGRLALDETEHWFDGVTVKKDVKEINNAVKLFEKAAGEVGTLQHRIEALYEDIGTKLSRYYEIADIDNTIPLAPKNQKQLVPKIIFRIFNIN